MIAAEATDNNAIQLEHVTKTFKLESGQRVTALDDVSLRVQKGEFVCVIGPSGHGKTTLLNLIAGLVSPTTGKVVVSGGEVTGPGQDRGVVFQRDTVFPWKRVEDNITFGLKARGVRRAERSEIAARYLETIGLVGYGRAWPKQLSGGMRRRVAIASVFANRPDVLLLDEPFTGLDYMRREALYRVLENLWQELNNTILFITHDVDEALTLADRLIIMVRGRLIFEVRLGWERPRQAEVIGSEKTVAIRREIMHHLASAFQAPDRLDGA